MTDGKVEIVKAWVDVLSVGTLLAWFVDIAPQVAVVFTAIWSVLRVAEMQTTRNFLRWLFKRT